MEIEELVQKLEKSAEEIEGLAEELINTTIARLGHRTQIQNCLERLYEAVAAMEDSLEIEIDEEEVERDY